MESQRWGPSWLGQVFYSCIPLFAKHSAFLQDTPRRHVEQFPLMENGQGVLDCFHQG